MRAITVLKLRLRTLLRSRRLDRELEEELAYHIDREAGRNEEGGMTEGDARTAAMRSFGRAAQIQEQCREERHAAWFTGALRDLQHGLRNLRRAPGFVVVVAATLGLGIGANTAVFGIANGLLFRRLPVPEPERLFQVLQPDGPGLTEFGDLFATSDFADMHRRVTPYATLAAQSEPQHIMASIEGEQEEPVRRAAVSENYFAVLGIKPAIGRAIGTYDTGSLTASPAAVVSYTFWQRRLDSDAAALGRRIRIGKKIFEIAGVAEPGFFGIDLGTSIDIWTPLASEPVRPRSRSIRLIGRLKPGATVAQAGGPLQAVFHRRMVDMAGRIPARTPQSLIDRILRLGVKLVPAGGGISPFRGDAAKPLFIVFGLVGLVLLMACATVGALFEARHGARRGEMGVRISLGAGRWRLMRQLFCEALPLAGFAAGVGLILARWMGPLLLALLTASGGRLESPRNTVPVLAFTSVLGLLATLLFALAPAWRLSAVNPTTALPSSAGRPFSERARSGKLAVLAQVSISMVLVLAAGAFVRTLIHLYNADTGFDRRNVIVADVQFRRAERGERLARAWRELRERVAVIPGVEAVSLSSGSPFDGAYGYGMLRIPGASIENQGCAFFLASDGFFGTTGIRMLQGRDFQAGDFGPDAPPVAVVSESTARQLFPRSDAVGRKFSNAEDNTPQWVTIVGVVRDIKFENLRNAATRIVYLPYTRPRPITAMSVILRARADVTSLGGSLRRAASIVDPDLTVRRITSQTRLIDDSLSRERLLARVAVVFGGLALLMAVIGIYGVTSCTVTKRTPEIGIRMALGAARSSVVGMIFRESALVVTAGAAIGLAVSMAVERLVAALFFGATAHDPATLLTAALFVLAVSIAAALPPARRAANMDPVIALRSEAGIPAVERRYALRSAIGRRPVEIEGSSHIASTGRPAWAVLVEPPRHGSVSQNRGPIVPWATGARTKVRWPRLMADACLFSDLVRHFFGRFFDKESLSPQGKPEASIIQTLGLLTPPSGFACLLLMIAHPRGWQLVEVRFLLICYSMIVIGVAMVFEWDALFPDRRDYLILTPLPLRVFPLFAAKMTALWIFLGLFLAAINLFGVLLWPDVERSGSFFIVAGAHLIVMITAGLFSALAIAALQGVLATVLRGAAYRRVSVGAQTALMAVLILFLFLSPMMAASLPSLSRASSPYLHWVPPFWFAGLYERIRPVVSRSGAGKTLAGLGTLAIQSIWIAFALFTATFLPGYRGHARRALEMPEPSHNGPGRLRRALSLIFARLLRDPVEIGVFEFIGQTISRSIRHRLFLATYSGFGAAMVVIMTAHEDGSLRLPLALSFVLISGLRAAFNFPSDLRANWAFQVNEISSAAAYLRATRKWLMLCAVLPLFFAIALTEAIRSPWELVVFHFAFGISVSLVLVEALFLGFHKVPFTCSHFPGKMNLVFLTVVYVFGFTLYSGYLAQLEELLWHKPSWAATFFLASYSGLIALSRTRERLISNERGLEYEDDGDPVIRTLGLTEQ